MRLRQLIENVLLYDQVVVPTGNFLSIRFLSQAFGMETLAVLMDEEILKFNRLIGEVVYAGAGTGLTVIKVDVPASRKNNAPVSPAWWPTGVAATAILAELPGVTSLRAKQVAAKFVHATKDIDLDSLRTALRNRTISTAHSPTIDSKLRVEGSDLDNLGIRPNQIKILEGLGSDIERDDVGKALLIARTELEILAKERSGCDDLSTLSPIGKILAAKTNEQTALERLYQISEVPDLGTAVMNGAVSIKQIIDLRSSRNWQEFAKWFHESCASEPDRVGREYVRLLKATAPLDSTFFKIVRLLLPLAVSVFSPAASIAVTAADSFVVPKIRSPSAKYFVEELEQLTRRQAKEL
jgi:hypothetical protein